MAKLIFVVAVLSFHSAYAEEQYLLWCEGRPSALIASVASGNGAKLNSESVEHTCAKDASGKPTQPFTCKTQNWFVPAVPGECDATFRKTDDKPIADWVLASMSCKMQDNSKPLAPFTNQAIPLKPCVHSPCWVRVGKRRQGTWTGSPTCSQQ
jgi:hypothetical protein